MRQVVQRVKGGSKSYLRGPSPIATGDGGATRDRTTVVCEMAIWGDDDCENYGMHDHCDFLVRKVRNCKTYFQGVRKLIIPRYCTTVNALAFVYFAKNAKL